MNFGSGGAYTSAWEGDRGEIGETLEGMGKTSRG